MYVYSHVAALGALSCIVLMFYINAAYAGVTMGMRMRCILHTYIVSIDVDVCIAVMVILFIYLLLRGPATPWGDVSQALIYHQVCVYLYTHLLPLP